MKRLAKAIAAASSLLLAAITLGLAALAIARARLPYEHGRYFDPVDSVVYHEGSALVYGLLAAACALLTIAALWGMIRLFNKGR